MDVLLHADVWQTDLHERLPQLDISLLRVKTDGSHAGVQDKINKSALGKIRLNVMQHSSSVAVALMDAMNGHLTDLCGGR